MPSLAADPDQKDRFKGPETSSLSDHSTGKHSADVHSSLVAFDDLVDAEPEPFKLTNWMFRRHLYKVTNPDAIATKRSVYDDPDMAHNYWPKADYENLHRFDPKARWTYREEQVSLYSRP